MGKTVYLIREDKSGEYIPETIAVHRTLEGAKKHAEEMIDATLREDNARAQRNNWGISYCRPVIWESPLVPGVWMAGHQCEGWLKPDEDYDIVPEDLLE